MAIYRKAITGNDIINGLAVICPPDRPSVIPGNGIYAYDGGTLRTQHLASGDSLLEWQRLDTAFKYHGGVGGSGNWEH